MATRLTTHLPRTFIAARFVTVLCLLFATVIHADAQECQASINLDSYTLDYPAAEQFCPPIRSTFHEVTQTMMMVKGKQFRQQLNGGYGLPVAMVVNGKNMLHVGADLGWHQVGEPVFAVASGVVRVSTGSELAKDGKRASKSNPDANASKDESDIKNAARPSPNPGEEKMEWGNLVVIEHETQEGEFFTTIYGHLATNRLVKTGEVVEAGQQIGVIGRQHPRVNGGYKPHLHFGVRTGRMVEQGAPLVQMRDVNGNEASVTIAEIGEKETEVDVPEGFPDTFELATRSGKIAVIKREDKHYVPSRILWEYQRPGFAIVGYSLTTDGWRDPIEFLKEQSADTAPAPFQPLTAKEMRLKNRE